MVCSFQPGKNKNPPGDASGFSGKNGNQIFRITRRLRTKCHAARFSAATNDSDWNGFSNIAMNAAEIILRGQLI
jgi:hypothetical protein